jgi:hypothetical protein
MSLQRHNIEALAQGMIEFPPPQKLRDIGAKIVGNEDEKF